MSSRRKRSRRRTQADSSKQQNIADNIGQLLHALPVRLAAGLKQAVDHLARPQSQALFAALNIGQPSKRFTSPDAAVEVRHQADLRQLFRQIDADGNGKLDQTELQVTQQALVTVSVAASYASANASDKGFTVGPSLHISVE